MYHVRNAHTVSKLILIDVILKIILESILSTVKTNDRIYMLQQVMIRGRLTIYACVDTPRNREW